MELSSLPILTALGQSTRWRTFELLLARGDDGMLASEIADALGIHRNLMSTHLRIMREAGLVTSTKSGREVSYSVTPDAARKVATDMLSAIDRTGA
jgi:DNA-binding MarR family transcriptional regulator